MASHSPSVISRSTPCSAFTVPRPLGYSLVTFVSVYIAGFSLVRPAQATLDSASAGRSRAARQPPNDPAIRPPRIARTTAATTAATVTGADRWTATEEGVEAARPKPPVNPPPPPPPKPPPPPNVRAPPGVAVPVLVGS